MIVILQIMSVVMSAMVLFFSPQPLSWRIAAAVLLVGGVVVATVYIRRESARRAARTENKALEVQGKVKRK
jgi:membrane protein YdbS with pleckstrin-like domain